MLDDNFKYQLSVFMERATMHLEGIDISLDNLNRNTDTKEIKTWKEIFYVALSGASQNHNASAVEVVDRAEHITEVATMRMREKGIL